MSSALAENNKQIVADVEGPKKKAIVEATQQHCRQIPYTRISEAAGRLENEESGIAGVEMRAAEEAVIQPKDKACISTDIQMAIPAGFYGRVAPLDSLAQNHMIQTGAGVIDADYRGTVKILLFNHGTEAVTVRPGEAIAKMIIEEIHAPSEIQWDKADENAVIPTLGSAAAAGADLTSAEECIVPARGQFVVETNLVARFPNDCYGRVAPRSGLAAKKFIHVGGGACWGEDIKPILVLLFNHSDTDFKVAPGDRIAQFVLQKAASSGSVPDEVAENVDENGDVPSKKRKCGEEAPLKFRGIVSPMDVTIEAKGKVTIPIQLQETIPEGHYARIAPLFQRACRESIDVGGGVHTSVDNFDLILFNYGSEDVKIEKDEFIAQLIFEKATKPVFELRETLEETARGAGGFGSTGVKAS